MVFYRIVLCRWKLWLALYQCILIHTHQLDEYQIAWHSDRDETPGSRRLTLTWDLRFVLCHSLSQIKCDPHRDYNTKFKPSVIQLSDALPFYCLFYGKTGASSCDQFWLNIQIVCDSQIRRVAFTASVGIQSAAPLNHTAQSDPGGAGRIEFAAILSNNIPWMSLPQGLREEGRGGEWRDGEKPKSDKRKNKRALLDSQTPHLQNVPGSFSPTHTCTRLPFLRRTPLEPSVPVFLSYVWRFDSMQAWHARPPEPYSTLENQSLPCRRASKGPVQSGPLPACWVQAFKCHWLILETCTEMHAPISAFTERRRYLYCFI